MQEVPLAPSLALTVRWASDDSVYLSRLAHGVAEVALDGGLTVLRQPIPDRQSLGLRFPMFERLAVSPEHLVVGSLAADYAFRPRLADADGRFRLSKLRVWSVQGLDVYGGRLLLLGDPRPRALDESPSRGGIAWIGPLSEHPERDMRPFLFAPPGAPPPTHVLPRALHNCMALELGGVRFLADGSYLVVPGFQNGVRLYAADGTLVRSWDNEAVGLDAPDCAGLDPAAAESFASSYRARFDFLNQRRVLDEIVPLADGPALLVRQVTGATVHWTLNVLGADRVLRHTVPIVGDAPYDRLRADARGGRLALLRTWHGFDRGAASALRPGHLYLASFVPAGSAVAR